MITWKWWCHQIVQAYFIWAISCTNIEYQFLFVINFQQLYVCTLHRLRDTCNMSALRVPALIHFFKATSLVARQFHWCIISHCALFSLFSSGGCLQEAREATVGGESHRHRPHHRGRSRADSTRAEGPGGWSQRGQPRGGDGYRHLHHRIGQWWGHHRRDLRRRGPTEGREPSSFASRKERKYCMIIVDNGDTSAVSPHSL